MPESSIHPTSIRLAPSTREELAKVAKRTSHSRQGLISYAVDALIAHFKSTGQLPPIKESSQG